MPNLAICLMILRFALFGSRDPPTKPVRLSLNLSALFLVGFLYRGFQTNVLVASVFLDLLKLYKPSSVHINSSNEKIRGLRFLRFILVQ